MVIVQRIQTQTGEVVITRRAMTLTLSERFHSIYTFDIEGRFLSCFLSGKNYRRSLDSRIMVKYWDGERKMRQLLSPDERETLIDHVLHHVRALGEQVGDELDSPTRIWLDRIQTWDAKRLAEEQERFAAIYPSGVGMLPPDQYLSVVLQATKGCSWNRCTFCSLYRGKPFEIATPKAFAEHIQQVKAFLGLAIGMRRSLFLADANALIIPQPRLLSLLDLIHQHFPIGQIPFPGIPRSSEATSALSTADPLFSSPYTGIYAFLDLFGAERKSFEDYRELQKRGVRRIYIGLETGDDAVFQLLNKPGSPQDALEIVRTIKRADIQVGIILLVGAGGEKLAEQHIAHSSQLVAAMPLDQGDIIYLSPLTIDERTHYTQQLRDIASRPFSYQETRMQLDVLKHTIKGIGMRTWMHPSGPPRITAYHIEEFLY